MNIKEARQEIINTVRAYEAKDETGAYLVPVEKQRPMLLIGPPGIGKTAIMEQVANELGINLVSYTMTHHTRQSAIGLPMISHKVYGGKEYAVTEYTMSEIVASVYDQIQRSGVKEGILFLDEINCVSETLAPAMLQFLQYKTFGAHRIPNGFVIVTAGNPPEYNKSVRDFDIVTLDRVRRLDITEDFAVWKEYAYKAGIHGAILAYLEIKKQNFYSIRTEVEEKYFVTARGWEDLSRILQAYEKLGIPVTGDLVREYLQDPQIAGDFSNYYELYNKYRNIYRIPDIIEGRFPSDTQKIHDAPFDEKLSLISLLIERLNEDFRTYAQDLEVQRELMKALGQFHDTWKAQAGQEERAAADAGKQTAAGILAEVRQQQSADLSHKEEAKLVSREELRTRRMTIAALEELEKRLVQEQTGDAASDFAIAARWFDEREGRRQEQIQETGTHLSNSFAFLARTFGEGQEMVIFLSELSGDYYALKYVQECGNEAYYRYNKLLLLQDRQADLRNEVLRLSK